ncbi:MAG: hypothetical protein R2932_13795 [Caldilineaceae bacterium]
MVERLSIQTFVIFYLIVMNMIDQPATYSLTFTGSNLFFPHNWPFGAQ